MPRGRLERVEASDGDTDLDRMMADIDNMEDNADNATDIEGADNADNEGADIAATDIEGADNADIEGADIAAHDASTDCCSADDPLIDAFDDTLQDTVPDGLPTMDLALRLMVAMRLCLPHSPQFGEALARNPQLSDRIFEMLEEVAPAFHEAITDLVDELARGYAASSVASDENPQDPGLETEDDAITSPPDDTVPDDIVYTYTVPDAVIPELPAVKDTVPDDIVYTVPDAVNPQLLADTVNPHLPAIEGTVPDDIAYTYTVPDAIGPIVPDDNVNTLPNVTDAIHDTVPDSANRVRLELRMLLDSYDTSDTRVDAYANDRRTRRRVGDP